MLQDILQLTRPLILLDLETTDHNNNVYAIEFGMQVYRPNTSAVDEYRTYINPGVPISEGARAVHGITDELLATGCAKCGKPQDDPFHVNETPICDALNVVGAHIWTPIPKWSDLASNIDKGFANADFAGYSVDYDLQVISKEQQRAGYTFDYSKAYVLDAFKLWRILEPRTLSDAVEHFGGKKHVDAHTALGDVRGTAIVLNGQFQHRNAHKLPRTMEEIHRLCFSDRADCIDRDCKFKFINGVACFNFGPNRGKPVKDNVKFLRWMVGKDFSLDTMRVVSECLVGNIPTKQP